MLVSRFVIVLFFLVFSCSTNSIAGMNFQIQTDFLDELLEEIENTNTETFTTISQTEIDEYIEDIKKLKKALNNIEIEKSKANEDETELQKLVDEYNQRIADLQKSHRFIMSRANKKNCGNEFPTSRLNPISETDSLDCERKRRKIKDSRMFAPLEIVEVPGGISLSKSTDERSPATLIKNGE